MLHCCTTNGIQLKTADVFVIETFNKSNKWFHSKFLHTSMSKLVTSWVAISTHPFLTALEGRSASLYQLRLTECAYAAAGDACWTRVVVTIPTDLPGQRRHKYNRHKCKQFKSQIKARWAMMWFHSFIRQFWWNPGRLQQRMETALYQYILVTQHLPVSNNSIQLAWLHKLRCN